MKICLHFQSFPDIKMVQVAEILRRQGPVCFKAWWYTELDIRWIDWRLDASSVFILDKSTLVCIPLNLFEQETNACEKVFYIRYDIYNFPMGWCNQIWEWFGHLGLRSLGQGTLHKNWVAWTVTGWANNMLWEQQLVLVSLVTLLETSAMQWTYIYDT